MYCLGLIWTVNLFCLGLDFGPGVNDNAIKNVKPDPRIKTQNTYKKDQTEFSSEAKFIQTTIERDKY